MELDYHKDYTHWSKSLLTKFLKSPLVAKRHMNDGSDSTAYNFGRAYHSNIEGAEYHIYSMDDRPNQKAKLGAVNLQWIEDLMQKHETVVSEDENSIIQQMVAVLKDNPNYKKLAGLKHVQEEVFKAEIEGFKVKCKVDAIAEDSCLIVDWKTCASIDKFKILYAVRDYDYDMQAALYCDILHKITGKPHNFLFFFQEKAEPYDVVPVLIRFESETYMKGREKYLTACAIAKNSFENDSWEGAASNYDNGIFELN